MTAAKRAAIGSLWTIEAAGTVLVTRPDGTEVAVAGNGKSAGHVLDMAGDYTATTGDGSTVTTTAG